MDHVQHRSGELTQFIQPNSTPIGLNRVIGGLGPSLLDGTLKANVRIFLVNPNGVLIGSGGVINTAGFVATTNDISTANFMASNYNLNIPGRPTRRRTRTSLMSRSATQT